MRSYCPAMALVRKAHSSIQVGNASSGFWVFTALGQPGNSRLCLRPQALFLHHELYNCVALALFCWMCNQDKRCNLTQCHTGVKLKGPDDEEDDLDEVLGSPQSSLVMPSVPSLEDSSLGEQDSMSANALAEDERTAEAAGSLKDESQVSTGLVTLADELCMTCLL